MLKKFTVTNGEAMKRKAEEQKKNAKKLPEYVDEHDKDDVLGRKYPYSPDEDEED